MTDFTWLENLRFQSLSYDEFSWTLQFGDDVTIVVTCLWRLLESGCIRITSEDHGQWFGLPAARDSAAEVNSRLVGAHVVSVVVRDGTLDLDISLDTGHVIQVIPDSSGYESWNLRNAERQFIAVGGGTLAIFDRSD